VLATHEGPLGPNPKDAGCEVVPKAGRSVEVSDRRCGDSEPLDGNSSS